MKRVVVMALLTASYFTINAQTDPKAKVILDDVSAKTKSYTSIKADFSFVTEKKDKTKETQNGKIQIKGNKYKLEIPGHEIYCDGKTVWDFIKDANEVQIKDADTGGEDAINPSTIFTLYEKGFKYKLDGEDATTQTISLFPINPDKKKFHTAKLVIEKAKKQIASLKMLMKDGTSQTYTIKSFTTNAVVSDSDFVFDTKAHAGVSVEDLR
ncbi:MAG TPA: outer membrane lipoprotein carrier protein LolA [Bacteroidia bacterium]|jgi:outer membrane lipoprotein-sorting protein|nr:outer membrane lipoprotein carrier protein LolA [Bacteroidia bacterium]